MNFRSPIDELQFENQWHDKPTVVFEVDDVEELLHLDVFLLFIRQRPNIRFVNPFVCVRNIQSVILVVKIVQVWINICALLKRLVTCLRKGRRLSVTFLLQKRFFDRWIARTDLDFSNIGNRDINMIS